jgi:large subunit ribosomal protein L9
LAEVATAKAKISLERNLITIRRKAEKLKQIKEEHSKQIAELGQLMVKANVGEGGRLFGTITTKDLSMMLSDKLGFEIDRKTMTLSEPIHRTGLYDVTIKLHPEVTAVLSLQVEADTEA